MHFALGSIDMFGLQAEYHNICVNNHTLGNIWKNTISMENVAQGYVVNQIHYMETEIRQLKIRYLDIKWCH